MTLRRPAGGMPVGRQPHERTGAPRAAGDVRTAIIALALIAGFGILGFGPDNWRVDWLFGT